MTAPDLDALILRLEAVTAVLRSGKITDPTAAWSVIAEGQELTRRLGATPLVGNDLRHRVATAQAACAAASLPFADEPSRARLAVLLAERRGAWASVGRPIGDSDVR